MTEFDFWRRYVKKALHIPPLFIAKKQQDRYTTGTADVRCMLRGRECQLEMKYLARMPHASKTMPAKIIPTPAQRIELDEWVSAGGNAYVLVGVGDAWYLFAPSVAKRFDNLSPAQFIEHALISGLLKNMHPLREYLQGQPMVQP